MKCKGLHVGVGVGVWIALRQVFRGIGLVLLMATVGPAQDTVPAFSVLYSFAGGATGTSPRGGLIADAAGNLYGTTTSGGDTSSSVCHQASAGCGVVFKVDPSGTETVLYSFTGGADGSMAQATLVLDAAGNLYGTTPLGGNTGAECPLGSLGCGVVFEVEPSGTETVLHTFIGPEGAEPNVTLIQDPAGNLYGTTFSGGGYSTSCPYNISCGVVFKVAATGRFYQVLHRFTGGNDGGNASTGLIRDSTGNLYGATDSGGTGDVPCVLVSFGCGVVYQMDQTGSETVLYNFTGGSDGYQPEAPLLRDSAGDLYGTTGAGGSLEGVCGDFQGCGVVFKLDPSGHQTILYTFQGGPDGAVPVGNLIRDAAGNLYGTTFYGGDTGTSCIYGAHGCGVVFKLDPSGTETVLHAFTGGSDGANPAAGLLLYKGILYGTASGGGLHGAGAVFRTKL